MSDDEDNNDMIRFHGVYDEKDPKELEVDLKTEESEKQNFEPDLTQNLHAEAKSKNPQQEEKKMPKIEEDEKTANEDGEENLFDHDKKNFKSMDSPKKIENIEQDINSRMAQNINISSKPLDFMDIIQKDFDCVAETNSKNNYANLANSFEMRKNSLEDHHQYLQDHPSIPANYSKEAPEDNQNGKRSNSNENNNYLNDNYLKILEDIQKLKLVLMKTWKNSKENNESQLTNQIKDNIKDFLELLNFQYDANLERLNFINNNESKIYLKSFYYKDIMLMTQNQYPKIDIEREFQNDIEDIIEADNQWSLLVLEQLFIYEQKSKKNFIQKQKYDTLLLKCFRQRLNETKSEVKYMKLREKKEKTKVEELFIHLFDKLVELDQKAQTNPDLNTIFLEALEKGKFRKNDFVGYLNHSIIRGDRGGYYVLLNTIDNFKTFPEELQKCRKKKSKNNKNLNSRRRIMIKKIKKGRGEGRYTQLNKKKPFKKLSIELMKFNKKNMKNNKNFTTGSYSLRKQKKSEHKNKILIGKGGFGEVTFALCLLKPDYSPFIGAEIQLGEMNCVKKTVAKKKIPTTDLFEIFSYHSSSQLIGKYLVPLYDSRFHKKAENVYVGYTVQKLVIHEKINLEKKSPALLDQHISYMILLFKAVEMLVEKNIFLPDLSPDNFLFDPAQEQGFLIDLGGRILLKRNEKLNTKVLKRDFFPHKSAYFKADLLLLESFEIEQSYCYTLGVILSKFLKNWPKDKKNNLYIALNNLASELTAEKLICLEASRKLQLILKPNLQKQKKIDQAKIKKIMKSFYKRFKDIKNEKLYEFLESVGFDEEILEIYNYLQEEKHHPSEKQEKKWIEKRFVNDFLETHVQFEKENNHEEYKHEMEDIDGTQIKLIKTGNIEPKPIHKSEFTKSDKIKNEIDETFDEFINDNKQKLLILLGEAGTGKSSILKLKYLHELKKLIVKFKNDAYPLRIPFFINFANREFSLQKFWTKITDFLKNNHFIQEQDVIPFQRLIFWEVPILGILDAFDEGKIDYNFVRLFMDEIGHNKMSKFVISSRLSYHQSNENFIYLIGYNKDHEKIKYILPFEDVQLIKVIPPQRYELLESNDLLQYAKNGYLLKLILSIDELKFEYNLRICRMDIIDKYVESLYSSNEKNLENKKNKILIIPLLLAEKLYLQRERVIKGAEFEYFIDEIGSKPKDNPMFCEFQAICPNAILKRKNTTISFDHDLLKNYYIVRSVENYIKEMDPKLPHSSQNQIIFENLKKCILNKHYIREDLELVYLFAEYIQLNKDFRTKLKWIVKNSKEITIKEEENKYILLRSNIMTLLNAANVPFNNLKKMDLEGADLRNGIFNDCELDNANTKNVDMTYAKIYPKESKRAFNNSFPISFVRTDPGYYPQEISVGYEGRYLLALCFNKHHNKTDVALYSIHDDRSLKVCKIDEIHSSLKNACVNSIATSSKTFEFLLGIQDQNIPFIYHYQFIREGLNEKAKYIQKFRVSEEPNKILALVLSQTHEGRFGFCHDNKIKIWDYGNKNYERNLSVVASQLVFHPTMKELLFYRNEIKQPIVEIWNFEDNQKIVFLFTKNVSSFLLIPNVPQNETKKIEEHTQNYKREENFKEDDKENENQKEEEKIINNNGCGQMKMQILIRDDKNKLSLYQFEMDIENRKELTIIDNLSPEYQIEDFSDSNHKMCISEDGLKLFTISKNFIHIRSLKNDAEILKSLEGETQKENISLAISNDAIFSGTELGFIRIFQDKRVLLKRYQGHSEIVRDLKFSFESDKILSGSYDRSARIFDAKCGKLLKIIKPTSKDEVVSLVGFSFDESKIYLVRGKRSITIIDLPKFKVIWENFFTYDIKCVSFLPMNNNCLLIGFCGNNSETLQIIDLKKLEIRSVKEEIFKQSIETMQQIKCHKEKDQKDNDHENLFLIMKTTSHSFRPFVFLTLDQTYIKLNEYNQQTHGNLYEVNNSDESRLKFTAFIFRNKNQIITGSQNGQIILWSSPDRFTSVRGDDKKEISCFVVPNSQNLQDFFLSGSVGNQIYIWRIENYKKIIRIYMIDIMSGHKAGITSLQISHDDRRIISSSIDRTIIWWKVEYDKEKKIFKRVRLNGIISAGETLQEDD